MKLITIETGNLKLDGGAMFGVVPKVIWNKLYPCDENNLCNWAMRCLLVDDGKRKILIDNGIGDKQDEKFLRHYYLNGKASLESSLNMAGYSFEDITDILLTHLHFDHCGGSVKYDKKGQLPTSFPNANYWVSEAQWESAVNPNRRERASMLTENIMPIKEAGQLRLIEKEMELFPDFHIKMYDGHTVGQIIPEITVEGKTIAYMADLLPSAAHIPMPYIMAYDMNPLETLKDKKRFFKNALEKDTILFFEHDLYNECCSIQQTAKGVRAKETFKLSEIFSA